MEYPRTQKLFKSLHSLLRARLPSLIQIFTTYFQTLLSFTNLDCASSFLPHHAHCVQVAVVRRHVEALQEILALGGSVAEDTAHAVSRGLDGCALLS